jgi:hypothetical protein
MNNGTVGGHKYFTCRPKCGLLVAPGKISIPQEPGLYVNVDNAPTAKKNPVFDGGDDATDAAAAADDLTVMPMSTAGEYGVSDIGVRVMIAKEVRASKPHGWPCPNLRVSCHANASDSVHPF